MMEMACFAPELEPLAFDARDLLKQLAGDQALMKLILQTFRSEWPRRLAGIHAALLQRDQAVLIRHAHTLKGSARQLSAAAAAAASARVEHAARQGVLSAGASDLDALEVELRRLDRDIVARLGDVA
jgi:HPt (histidine-containing phosphotransfer) domain-containing protein